MIGQTEGLPGLVDALTSNTSCGRQWLTLPTVRHAKTGSIKLCGRFTMNSRRVMNRVAFVMVAAVALYLAGGFVLTPKIDVQAHKPVGQLLWSKIEAYRKASGRFPNSESELLSQDIFTASERRMFLDRNFGHRKFHYIVDSSLGPSLHLDHMPGALYVATAWYQKTNSEHGAASGFPSIRSETNSTSLAPWADH